MKRWILGIMSKGLRLIGNCVVFASRKSTRNSSALMKKAMKVRSCIYMGIEKDIKNCIVNDYTLPFHLTLKCLIAEGYETISLSLCGKTAIYHKTCRDLIGEKIVSSHKKSRETSNILQIVLRDNRLGIMLLLSDCISEGVFSTSIS